MQNNGKLYLPRAVSFLLSLKFNYKYIHNFNREVSDVSPRLALRIVVEAT